MVADQCSRDGNRSRSNAFVSEEISVEGRRNAPLRQFRFQERDMAEDSKSGGTNFLYFIVGGIVVVVALLAFLYMGKTAR